MTLFGFLWFIVMPIAIVIGLVRSYKNYEPVDLGAICFALMVWAFFTGIYVQHLGTREDSIEVSLNPDTLVVTGYLLEIDTLKVGE